VAAPSRPCREPRDCRGEDARPARAVCAGCLVREECLAHALAHPSYLDSGVWGDTSERERKRLRGWAVTRA
jgi:WhiB family redox-sensing transcriptional regulator